jgi:hypothetical protein
MMQSVKGHVDVKMAGLLDMPLEEWLKARVKEIATGGLLPESTAPTPLR